eukprot:7379114-Prymnesium_polylepis.1
MAARSQELAPLLQPRKTDFQPGLYMARETRRCEYVGQRCENHLRQDPQSPHAPATTPRQHSSNAATLAAKSLTPGPKSLQHRFGGFKLKFDSTSIPKTVHTQNSPDLSSGRRPKSKSVEFSV